jgi:hypothetical protein
MARGSGEYFLPCHKGSGAPSFALFAKGGMRLLFPPTHFPATSANPTLRRKREGWGTRSFVAGACGWTRSEREALRLAGESVD